jgi:hypothetical protein
MQKQIILVTNFDNSGENVAMIGTNHNLNLYKAVLETKGLFFDDICEVEPDQLQYYVYDPIYVTNKQDFNYFQTYRKLHPRQDHREEYVFQIEREGEIFLQFMPYASNEGQKMNSYTDSLIQNGAELVTVYTLPAYRQLLTGVHADFYYLVEKV